MLFPSKTKYKHRMKGRLRGYSARGCIISFGEYGLKAIEKGFLTSRQIESARIAINRRLKRVGKVWIRVYPDKPITKKPAETRMGKGKGSLDHWVSCIQPGRIIFEVSGAEHHLIKRALQLASYKLPFKTNIIQKEIYEN